MVMWQVRDLLMLGVCLYAGPSFGQGDDHALQVERPGCSAGLTLAQLRALPLQEMSIVERDGGSATYQGAWLGDVLDLGCDSTAKLDKHGVLRAAVKVIGSDGFVAVVALAEAVPDYRERPVMLAWSREGKPLSDRHGPLQLVLADDRRPGRNVRQVSRLEVISP